MGVCVSKAGSSVNKVDEDGVDSARSMKLVLYHRGWQNGRRWEAHVHRRNTGMGDPVSLADRRVTNKQTSCCCQ